MTVNCKSLDDLPAMLTAAELAGALGISRAGAYALIHRKSGNGSWCQRTN